MIRIKDFICPHHGHKVLGLAQVDNVVGISRQHVDSLNLLPAHFKFDYFIRANLSLLDQAMTGNNNEEFPFAIMPVLSLCNSRLGDIHAELTMVGGLQQLSKASSQRNRWESPA